MKSLEASVLPLVMLPRSLRRVAMRRDTYREGSGYSILCSADDDDDSGGEGELAVAPQSLLCSARGHRP